MKPCSLYKSFASKFRKFFIYSQERAEFISTQRRALWRIYDLSLFLDRNLVGEDCISMFRDASERAMSRLPKIHDEVPRFVRSR